jgi:zinc transporter ZupT
MGDSPERRDGVDESDEHPEPTSDGGATVDREPTELSGRVRQTSAIAPLVLLALLLGAFALFTPLAGLQNEYGGEPLPEVTITHATLPSDDTVVLHVTNDGAEEVTVSQVLVDEAYWNFRVEGAGGDRTIEPRESARVVVPYHWNPGWDLDVDLMLSDGTTVGHVVEAPQQSPGVGGDVLWTLALVGLFVGVVPVALGMLWFPFLQTTSDRALHAVLLFAAGVLGFLAFDAGFEAFEAAERVPGAYEGDLLVVFGALGALLLVQAISAWREGRTAAGDGRANSGLQVAYLVALGVGLHNLAEGLAIGSSFAIGRVSLGTFLIVGFTVHNMTEGPAVIAPLARDERPALWHFGALGVLAGAPVILGGWIGGLAYSPTLGALFLAVGVGAIVQVIGEIAGLVREAGGCVGSVTNLLAFLGGFAVMYATDLLVVL